MIGMSRGRLLKFSIKPIGVFFGHVEDGEGEDGGVAVGVDFKHFLFYFLVMLVDGLAKQDDFVGFFDVVFPRWPEV